jgi:tetratricopeptide (TPR) repeat protein
MKGKQIAEWALAASVLVGVPVGGVMYPSSPVLAQRNQGDNFEALFKRAVELTQQGKYAEAERLYDRVLTILNRELPKLSPQQQQAIRSQEQKIVALAGINRGLLYASQGRDAEARQIWTESIGLLERALGRNHPDVLKMRQAIATYAQQQGSVLSPSDAVQKFIQKTLVENASIAFPNSGLQPLINQVVELSKQRQYIKVDLLNGQIFKSLKKMVSNSTSLTGKQKELIEAFL